MTDVDREVDLVDGAVAVGIGTGAGHDPGQVTVDLLVGPTMKRASEGRMRSVVEGRKKTGRNTMTDRVAKIVQ